MCCDTGIYYKMYCGTAQYICQYMTMHRRMHHNTSKIIHVLQDVAWPTCPVHGGKSLVGLGQSSADWPVCYVLWPCRSSESRIRVTPPGRGSLSLFQYICQYITKDYKMCCDTGIYCKIYCGTSQYICQYMTIHRRIHHNTSKIHVLQDVL